MFRERTLQFVAELAADQPTEISRVGTALFDSDGCGHSTRCSNSGGLATTSRFRPVASGPPREDEPGPDSSQRIPPQGTSLIPILPTAPLALRRRSAKMPATYSAGTRCEPDPSPAKKAAAGTRSPSRRPGHPFGRPASPAVLATQSPQ